MDTGFISIDGIACQQAMQAQFDAWCDDWHIPQSAKYGGLLGITRYRFAAVGGDASVSAYPDQLIVREFGNCDALETWNASGERRLAWQCFDELEAHGAARSWRVSYRHIASWKDARPTPLMSITGIHCEPQHEAVLNRWYSEKHVPDLLAFEEIRGVSRYELADESISQARDYPRFLAIYRFPDMATAQAFDTSAARAAARPDWLAVAKQTNAFRMWRARYTPVDTWHR